MQRKIERKEDSQKSITGLDKEFLSHVLMIASSENTDNININYRECSAILAKGANINAVFGDHATKNHASNSSCTPNDTPLTLAVKNGHLHLTHYLLTHGADTEIFGGAALKLCCSKLLQLDIRSTSYNTEKKQYLDCIKLLLEHGANPNEGNLESNSAMHE